MMRRKIRFLLLVAAGGLVWNVTTNLAGVPPGTWEYWIVTGGMIAMAGISTAVGVIANQ